MGGDGPRMGGDGSIPFLGGCFLDFYHFLGTFGVSIVHVSLGKLIPSTFEVVTFFFAHHIPSRISISLPKLDVGGFIPKCGQ